MGESSEMASEDAKALSDKNSKRTLKTRSQIEALESFYDEHKYPTESMKLLVAERIGLTEKQISSWFCHRRLKDKKILNEEVHGNGRQDRFSAAVQSGPRQDSCGSTKQSDDRNLGPIEVQSRRVNVREVFATDRHSHYSSSHSRLDDTSSGSSSSPHNMYSNGDHMPMVTSKFNTQSMARKVKSGKPRSGPSGYLKVKGRVENAAITAVKRQMGTLYREDGPPLDIVFDPLPQEAFESSTQQPANENYYAGEIVPHHASDTANLDQHYISKPYHVEERSLSPVDYVTRIHKQPTSSNGYGYTSNLSSPQAALDGKSLKMTHGSKHSRSSFHQMPKQDFSLSDHTEIDMHEQSAKQMPRDDRRNHNESNAMLGDCGFGVGSFSALEHFQPLGREINPEQEEPWSSHEQRRKIGRGDGLPSSYSYMPIEELENDAFVDQGLFRKSAKVNNLDGPQRKFDDDYDAAVQRNVSPNDQMRRAKDEYPPSVGKAPWEGVPQKMNQTTRSASFSSSSCSEDDENAYTTSAEDSEAGVRYRDKSSSH